MKLCQNMRRPVPNRADSIGVWKHNLVFLTWLGSLTMTSFASLSMQDAPLDQESLLWMFLYCLISEHGYLAVRRVVAVIASRFEDQVLLNAEQEQMLFRQQYLGSATVTQRPTEAEQLSIFWKQGPENIIVMGKEIMFQKVEEKQDEGSGQQLDWKKEL